MKKLLQGLVALFFASLLLAGCGGGGGGGGGVGTTTLSTTIDLAAGAAPRMAGALGDFTTVVVEVTLADGTTHAMTHTSDGVYTAEVTGFTSGDPLYIEAQNTDGVVLLKNLLESVTPSAGSADLGTTDAETTLFVDVLEAMADDVDTGDTAPTVVEIMAEVVAATFTIDVDALRTEVLDDTNVAYAEVKAVYVAALTWDIVDDTIEAVEAALDGSDEFTAIENAIADDVIIAPPEPGEEGYVFTDELLDNDTYYVTYTEEGVVTQEVWYFRSADTGYTVDVFTNEYTDSALTSSVVWAGTATLSEDAATLSVVLSDGENTDNADFTITGFGTSSIAFSGVNTDNQATWTGELLKAVPSTWLSTLSGDYNDDGAAYLYATDPALVDLRDKYDYFAIQEWSSGATLDGNYASDTTYDRVFALTPGTGWGASAAALAFMSSDDIPWSSGFAAGFGGEYTAMHFKFKGANYTSVNVKFAGATVEELTHTVSNATDLGDGWYGFSISLAPYGDMSGVTSFAILATGSDDFYLTDIYFDDTEIELPSTTTGYNYYLKSGDDSNPITIVYNTDYNNISDWNSNWGGAISDTVDATYGNVWTLTPGAGWGTDAAAIAFSGFTAGALADYTTIGFKYNNGGVYDTVSVKFPLAGTAEEVAIDLATYGTALGDNWYEVSFPLTGYGDLSGCTEFAIINYGTTAYMVTDLYLVGEPPQYYLKSGDDSNPITIVYNTDYNNISDWNSNWGGAISDTVDATYGNVWTLTPGAGWGTDAAAIAFSGFTAGALADYTTIGFKYNNGGVYDTVSVKFPLAGTAEEVAIDLATYGTALGDNWYEVSFPLTGYGDLSASTEFAIINYGTTAYMVTDLYFE